MKEHIRKIFRVLRIIFIVTYRILFAIGCILLAVFSVGLTILNFVLSLGSLADETEDEPTPFDKEADFWGLTKSEREMAKREMMSPEEFIIAEENNDDLLDGDEPDW